jgi:hypothetical protein
VVEFAERVAVDLLRQSTTGSQTVICLSSFRAVNSYKPLYIKIVGTNNNDEGMRSFISVDETLGDQVVDSVLVLHFGHKYHLCVASPDLLQSLKVTDLHGCLTVQLISCQPHQLGCLDVGSGRNDLTLS